MPLSTVTDDKQVGSGWQSRQPDQAPDRAWSRYWGDRAGYQKPARIVRMPDADMAIGVDHLLLGEDAIGNHQILDEGVEAVNGHDPI